MYVLHLLIDMLWRPTLLAALVWAGIWRPVAYMGLITAMSYVAAVLSYHLIEERFLELKGRFVQSEPQLTRGAREALSSAG